MPAFSEYHRTLERCHATAIPHPLDPREFLYAPQRLARDLAAAGADSLLLANPQNPSGVLTPASTILTLAAQLPGVTILLDEAFIDYCPDASVVPHLHTCPNLVVFRSVTKFHAIPGLRVAYALGHPDSVAKVRRQLAPWPVSTLAAIATMAALQSTNFQLTIDLNRTRRTQLLDRLKRLGITCPEPSANFLLLRLPRPALPVWEHLLRAHRILLRRCDNFESLGPEYLRTAVRNEQDNARLAAALADCLQQPPA